MKEPSRVRHLRKYIFTAIKVANLIIILFLAVVLFWFVYPYNPLVFKEKFTPTQKSFAQGSILWYRSNYCKFTALSTIVSRSFVDGIIYTTPTIIAKREQGCHNTVMGIAIPKELPIGTYHLENIYTYQMNPVRVVQIKQSSSNFEITESTKSAELRLQGY